MARAGWDIPAAAGLDVRLGADCPRRSARPARWLFSKLLIEEAGVAVAPGVGFGEHGEGFVRIGLVENEHRIRQAARNVKKFLQSVRPDPQPARDEQPAVVQ